MRVFTLIGGRGNFCAKSKCYKFSINDIVLVNILIVYSYVCTCASVFVIFTMTIVYTIIFHDHFV